MTKLQQQRFEERARKRRLTHMQIIFDTHKVNKGRFQEPPLLSGLVSRLARRLVMYGWRWDMRLPTERRLVIWEKAARRAHLRGQIVYSQLLRKARRVELQRWHYKQSMDCQLQKARQKEINRRQAVINKAATAVTRKRAHELYLKARAVRLLAECEEAARGWADAHAEAMTAMPKL
jgi:hypothetical protein